MARKGFLVTLVAVSIVMTASCCFASIEGVWSANGTATARASYRGRTATEKMPYVETFTFNSDSTFQGTDINGTWNQTKKKFTVLLDVASMEIYLQELFATEGLTVIVTITKSSLKGTENTKYNTVKGKLSINADLYVFEYGANMKLKLSAPFKGSRAINLAGIASEERESLSSLIKDQVLAAISALCASTE